MKNIKIIFTTLILITSIAFSNYVKAESTDTNGFGIGIIIGEPTGITMKYNNFPIIGIAWSFNNHFHVHCDYWFHHADVVNKLDWYIGIGLKTIFFTKDSKDKKNEDDKFGLGIRVPFGLQYFILKELELFGEIVPGISLIPATDIDFDFGIGVRYYF